MATNVQGAGSSKRVGLRGAKASSADVISAATPHHPIAGAQPNKFWAPLRPLSYWGNVQTDTEPGYGDCVTAEEAFAKACAQPQVLLPENVVVNWAKAHNAANGAQLPDVMNMMLKDGFKDAGHTYDDGPHQYVNFKTASVVQSAISIGPVKLGVAADQLSTVWEQHNYQDGWLATGFSKDTKVDHCVSLCGYGTFAWLAQQLKVNLPPGANGATPGYAMFTWGTLGIIDVPSMIAISSEAWIRNPTTIKH